MHHSDQSKLLVGYSATLTILSSLLMILRLTSRRLSAVRFWLDYALIIITLRACLQMRTPCDNSINTVNTHNHSFTGIFAQTRTETNILRVLINFNKAL